VRAPWLRAAWVSLSKSRRIHASILGEGCMKGTVRMNRTHTIHGSLGSFDRRLNRREKVHAIWKSSLGNDRVSALPPAPSAGLASPPADCSAITRQRSTSGPLRRYRGICTPAAAGNRLARRRHRRPDDITSFTPMSVDTARPASWASSTAA